MANPAFSGIYGGYKYESSESRALGSITPQSYDYRDQSKLMTKLTGDVSYMAAYMRKMQKGIDSANQNVIQQIQSLIQEIILIFGGDGDTGFDFGDLRYIFAAIGSLFGLQPGLPLPINLFAAAWFFFSNYIIPVDNFSDFLNEFVDSFLATMLDVLGEVPILGEAAQQLAVIISTIRDQLLPILDLIDGLLDAIGNPDLTAWNAFWTSLAPIFDMLTEVFGPYVGPPMAGVVVILSTILTWTEEMIASFGNVVNVFANFVANMSITENIIDTVTQFLSNMVSMLGAITGSTTDYLANTFSPIAGWANIFVAFLTEDVIPSITAAWTGSIAGQVITGALNGLLTVRGVTLNTLFTNINATGQLLASGLTGALNTAVTIGSTALSTLATNWNAAVTNINNLIGGVTGASTAADVATNINLAATNIAQIGTAAQNAAAGVVGSLNTAATQVQTAFSGILNGIFGAVTNFTVPAAAPVTTAQVTQAVAAVTSSTVAAGAADVALQSGERTVIGLKSEVVSFADYANSSSLPALFSTTYSGFGSGTYGVVDGKAAWVSLVGGSRVARNQYTGSNTTTDYQVVSATFAGSNTNPELIRLTGRMNAAGTTYVEAALAPGANQAAIYTVVDGTITPWITINDFVYNPTGTYSFECGDVNGGAPRKFRVLCNGELVPGLSYTESGTTSQLGTSYRGSGWESRASGTGGEYYQLPISQWSVMDQIARPGPPATAYVSTQQTTISTSYTDLSTAGPAVTTTIGSSGMALVTVYSYIGTTAGAIPNVGFAISGATTQAASDAYSLGTSLSNSTHRSRFSATFLLAGLAVGSTTFTMKYKTNAGTGTFLDRRIAVIPL